MTTDHTTIALDEIVNLPNYPCTHRVTGVERRRNHGPVLTLAIAEWYRPGFNTWPKVLDIVTLMRLADAVSHLHNLPVNAEKLYGPVGRNGTVGREPKNIPRHPPYGIMALDLTRLF